MSNDISKKRYIYQCCKCFTVIKRSEPVPYFIHCDERMILMHVEHISLDELRQSHTEAEAKKRFDEF